MPSLVDIIVVIAYYGLVYTLLHMEDNLNCKFRDSIWNY